VQRIRIQRARALGGLAAVILLVAISCGPGLSTAAAANPPTVKIYTNYSSWDTSTGHSSYSNDAFNGGEFDVQVTSGILQYTTQVKTWDQLEQGSSLGAYQFSTFCAQTGQYYTPGDPYYTETADTTDHTLPPGGGVALSDTTKWLFHLWNNKQLVYEYNESGTQDAARRSDAEQMQLLIWSLLAGGGASSDSRQQAWLAAAVGKLGGTVPNVKVLRTYVNPNLTGGGQDQLVELVPSGTPGGPVPEPASLALLAIGGLPVLASLRRRRYAT